MTLYQAVVGILALQLFCTSGLAQGIIPPEERAESRVSETDIIRDEYQKVRQSLIAQVEAGIFQGAILERALSELSAIDLDIISRDQSVNGSLRWSLVESAPYWNATSVELLKLAYIKHPEQLGILLSPTGLARQAELTGSELEFWREFLSDLTQRIELTGKTNAFSVIELLNRPWAESFEKPILRIIEAQSSISGSWATIFYKTLAQTNLPGSERLLLAVMKRDVDLRPNLPEIARTLRSPAAGAWLQARQYVLSISSSNNAHTVLSMFESPYLKDAEQSLLKHMDKFSPTGLLRVAELLKWPHTANWDSVIAKLIDKRTGRTMDALVELKQVRGDSWPRHDQLKRAIDRYIELNAGGMREAFTPDLREVLRPSSGVRCNAVI